MTSKVCLLGAGSTKYGKLNESIIEIALNAAKDAIDSAGITPKEIQAGYISNVFGVADKQVHMAPVIMSNLGISNVPGLTIESACGSGSVMFREAYANVAAGFYDCVLALGVEKVTHTGTAHSTTLFSYCSDFFYEGGNGASFPGLFASMARAYMNTHKATEEDLANVAVPLGRRVQNFVDAMPGARAMDRPDVRAAARLRRAAWNFAAELAHFGDPVRFPLVARWVWDSASQSGALREFIRGNDAMREIPFDNSAELHEGARTWLSGRIAGRGIYRDVALWIDLVLGQAYVSYLRSMANGSLGGEFARGAAPHEQLTKLLGIDTGGGRPPK